MCVCLDVAKCTEATSDDGGASTTVVTIGGADMSGKYGSCSEYWEETRDDMEEEANVLGGIWIALLFVVIAGHTMMFYGFGSASERLSRRVRDKLFTASVFFSFFFLLLFSSRYPLLTFFLLVFYLCDEMNSLFFGSVHQTFPN